MHDIARAETNLPMVSARVYFRTSVLLASRDVRGLRERSFVVVSSYVSAAGLLGSDFPDVFLARSGGI